MKYTPEQVESEREEFKKIAEQLIDLKTKKGADYGNSWSLMGLIGIICQIMSKAIRLWNLKDKEPDNEPLRDTFRDIAVYGLMGIALIDRNDIDPKI